mmetsp:Transcript_15371/g.33147  ORF Transcript_15371/g.33147 Transcript_15371/m.33147 type:complete len:246 (+) Transcript_15371:242-979(+)
MDCSGGSLLVAIGIAAAIVLLLLLLLFWLRRCALVGPDFPCHLPRSVSLREEPDNGPLSIVQNHVGHSHRVGRVLFHESLDLVQFLLEGPKVLLVVVAMVVVIVVVIVVVVVVVDDAAGKFVVDALAESAIPKAPWVSGGPVSSVELPVPMTTHHPSMPSPSLRWQSHCSNLPFFLFLRVRYHHPRRCPFVAAGPVAVGSDSVVDEWRAGNQKRNLADYLDGHWHRHHPSRTNLPVLIRGRRMLP